MAAGIIVNSFLNDVAWQNAKPGRYSLVKNEVHVWRIQISKQIVLTSRLSALLDDVEKLRGNKYLHDRDRNRFVVSRAAQRIILGWYLGIDPGKLKFKTGDNKKPFIAANNDHSIQFNISHSGDWIVLAVSKEVVGSDIEYIDPNFDFDDILPEHFSTAESRYVNAQDKLQRFYELWTRKEALLKATGQGLGEHLKDTSALTGTNAMHPSLLGNTANWQIQTFNLDKDYVASIAAKGNNVRLQFWSVDLGGVIFH